VEASDLYIEIRSCGDAKNVELITEILIAG
jgi:hypothetical protein